MPCPCTKTSCQFHGNCKACRQNHLSKKHPPMCERLKAEQQASTLQHKEYATPQGTIHYWHRHNNDGPTLVFLPGWASDHRLFNPQLEHFGLRHNCLVWDAPAHGLSRPFPLTFSLEDMARWLHAILSTEQITQPILIGHAQGGAVAQMFLSLFPNEPVAFIAIGSVPLRSSTTSAFSLWLLRHTGWRLRLLPWKRMRRLVARRHAATQQGRKLMRKMLKDYRPSEYSTLSTYGRQLLNDASPTQAPIPCPCLLLYGDKDRIGNTQPENNLWAYREGHSIKIVANAGHNANADNPHQVNRLIKDWLQNGQSQLKIEN